MGSKKKLTPSNVSHLSHFHIPSTWLSDGNAITNKLKINYIEELVKYVDISTISGKIKHHRFMKGWSQYELAKHLHLTPNQGRYLIKDYETRGLYPPIELSVKLAKIFNLNTKYFYDDYYEFLDSDYSFRISKWRKDNHLTVTAAAKKANVNYVTWSSWEKGKKISRENYYKIKLFCEL